MPSGSGPWICPGPVSYTHLDVYKRQASTGSEAYSLITSQCPDLVILDLGLPDMDGMNILRRDVYKRQGPGLLPEISGLCEGPGVQAGSV